MGSSSGTTIVAVPAIDDPVWDVSSEKVPHCTILFLGDQVSDADLASIAGFLEHAVDYTLGRFGLLVDRRGVLGDEQADVLFFDKYFTDDLERFRGYLLTHEAIQRAFHSVPQFPNWTPHLTLGYPETPAKSQNSQSEMVSFVSFDRIMLWTEDYSGVSIPLKNREEEAAAVSYPSKAELGESVAHTMLETLDDDLLHYGVKGMKWGVRKSDRAGKKSASTPEPSEDKASANESASRITKKGNTDALSNKDLQNLVNRMNLEQQYRRLSSQQDTMNRGRTQMKQFLETADMSKKAYGLVPSPAKAQVARALRGGLIGAASAAGRLYVKTRG